MVSRNAGRNGTHVELCVRRDAQRKGKAQVGRAVIERMALFAGLIDIPVSLSRGTRNLVILDIDGTVANLEHRREILRPKCAVCLGQGFVPDEDSALAGSDSPCGACGGKGFQKKDWYTFYSQVSQDTPIPAIIDLATTLRNAGYRILVVSGRPISWGDLEIGKETVKWLAENNVIYDHIFMRNGGDSREDTIVKQEILDKLPKDRIAYVLDDRDSVVKMWRDNGLTASKWHREILMKSLLLLLLAPVWFFFFVFIAERIIDFAEENRDEWWAIPSYMSPLLPT